MAKLDEKLLAMYYDGALRPAKAKKVEQMLAESPEHQESLNKMSRMTDLLHMMNDESLSDVSFAGFDKRVAIAIRQGEKTPLLERLRVYLLEFFDHRRIVWVPAAAVATVALAVMVAMPLVDGDPAPAGYAPMQEIRIMNGAGVTRAAEGGSTIVTTGQASTYTLDDGKGNSIGVAWIVDTP